jgi:phosphomevalonate kinase
VIETRAPGKLFILGEYAVVEAGEDAVLIAVDRYIHVRVTERATATTPPHSPHVIEAVRVVEQLRQERSLEPRHYDLDISSELQDGDGRKYGLGSSAAVTVAVIDALSRLYALELTRYDRFKLALLATIEVSPKASGGDVAASTYHGWIRYTSPDRHALGVTLTLSSDTWQACQIQRLPAPTDARLLVGWTGAPASTEQLVDRVAQTVKPSHEGDPEQWQHFLMESRACVATFVDAFTQADAQSAEVAISRARRALQTLGETSGIAIETEQLRMLCDIAEQHGASAKPSGAGGGDCGIVLAGPDSDIDRILQQWNEQKITPLSLTVCDPSHTEEGGDHDV